jgi:hypothetical protein
MKLLSQVKKINISVQYPVDRWNEEYLKLLLVKGIKNKI